MSGAGSRGQETGSAPASPGRPSRIYRFFNTDLERIGFGPGLRPRIDRSRGAEARPTVGTWELRPRPIMYGLRALLTGGGVSLPAFLVAFSLRGSVWLVPVGLILPGVVLVWLLWRSAGCRLVLDDEGVFFQNVLRKRRYRWSDLDRISEGDVVLGCPAHSRPVVLFWPRGARFGTACLATEALGSRLPETLRQLEARARRNGVEYARDGLLSAEAKKLAHMLDPSQAVDTDGDDPI